MGHSAVLHGCTIEDDCLIGIGAIRAERRAHRAGLGDRRRQRWCPKGAEIPPGSLVLGVPGKVRRPVTEEEQARFQANCANYVSYGQAFKEEQP